VGPYAFGFVVEETLGHRTYLHNLARWAEEDPSIRATWIPVPCWADDRWARMPVVRGNPSLSLSLRARDGVRAGLDLSRCDAILYHTQATALFSLGLARTIPVVVSLDATPINMDSVAAGYGHHPDGPGPQDWLKRQWYRCLFRRASALTAWTRWARESLIRDYGVDPGRVEVIPPGVDLDAWRPSHTAVGTRTKARLLFVGGDFRRKGGVELLRAYGSLSDRCELDVVTHEDLPGVGGGGPIRVHRGLSHDDTSLRRLFAEADIFVLPTLADCFPLAILEAMASGLAVVATDVGAIPEQVVDGETGLLVPAGDPEALARSLQALLDDPDRRIAFGVAGRRRAELHFDGARNYRSLVDLMKRCVPSRRSPDGRASGTCTTSAEAGPIPARSSKWTSRPSGRRT
jgi:glycosyltransferase involved in cell wall biosynthesis